MPQHPSYRAPFLADGPLAVHRDVCDRLLAAALETGGEFADLFFEYRASGSMSFDEGILRTASRSVSMGLGVRVQQGEATGFAHTEDLSWEKMLRAARTAARIARDGSPIASVAVGPIGLPHRYELLPVPFDEPGAPKRALLEQACASALREDPRIIKAEAGYSDSIREILVATSDGVLAVDSQPMFRFSVRAIAESGSARKSGSSGGGGRVPLSYFAEHTPDEHGRRAARQALVMLEAVEAPAGQLEVVLAPGDSGILIHEAVGHGLEADFNRKKTSNYAGMIGCRVASPLCSVVDDATVAGARGSINVDDEGVVPGRTTLIERGVLQGYMHDRMSARHYRLAPSGHGRRESFAQTALPRMTNTFLLGGDADPEEVLRSVRRGIYAKAFGGGQVDISNGDFVFSLIESYLIEDGKLGAPLKDVNLIGNGPDVLRNVVALGNDFRASDGIWTCGKAGQSVPVGVGCPTVKISRITIGGTKVS